MAAPLATLLQRLNSDNGTTILEPEADLLVSSFLPPNSEHRSSAYQCLAKFASNNRSPRVPTVSGSEEQTTEILARTFAVPIETRLSDTDVDRSIAAMSFLAGLFQVDPLAASAIFQRDGLMESVMETYELFPSSAEIQQALAGLLSQASGHKACRSIIAESAGSWLKAQVQQSSQPALRASAAMALTKLSKGTTVDEATSATGVAPNDRSADEENLATLMKEMVIKDEPGTVLDSVEGLAYLSVDPSIKELISNDATFLTRLFALVPTRPKITPAPEETKPSLGLLYGVASIVANVCAYPPKVSDEQAQIERLKRMTKGGISSGRLDDVEVDPLEQAPAVKRRCQKMIKAGALAALGVMARSESRSVCSAVGIAFLSMAEEQEHRGSMLQNGAAKSLMIIIRGSLQSIAEDHQDSRSTSPLDPSTLAAIQAICKLSITASPALIFGPSPSSSFEAIRPFTLLLLSDASSLLQKFESMMALTNLSSLGPEVSERIAKTRGVLGALDTFLLHDNILVRRAATELLCNLLASDEVFERYVPVGPRSSEGASSSRLQILVALSDVHDLQTRLAASGALAMLTSEQSVCQVLHNLEMDKHRVLYTMLQLISLDHAEQLEDGGEEIRSDVLDPKLLHRGIVCIRNFLKNTPAPLKDDLGKEAARNGTVEALVVLAKGIRNNPIRDQILGPLQEILFQLKSMGVQLTIE